MDSTTSQTAVAPLYAGFWRRVAASVVDCLILLFPAIVIDVVGGRANNLAPWMNIAVGCAYYVGFHSSEKQATPGKMAFAIKVADHAGARIGVLRAIARYFASWLSGLVVGIGFLMAGVTDKKQALHDMLAGTLVVNAQAKPEEIVASGGVMPLTTGVRVIRGLFVVSFVGSFLAAILLPAYEDYLTRGSVDKALAAIPALQSEIEQALVHKRGFKTGSIPVDSPGVKRVEVDASGGIVITLVPELAGEGTIVYRPENAAGGPIRWRCSSEGLRSQYLPRECRQ